MRRTGYFKDNKQFLGGVMKLLLTGDWHLTSSMPEKRIDDYPSVQKRKVAFIQHQAAENKCIAILQPGDLTEHFPFPKMNFSSIQYYIKKIMAGVPVVSIYGQHDSSFRTDKTNTPMKVFLSSGVVKLADENGIIYPHEDSYVSVYGAGYEEPIPEVFKKEDFNILLIHRMVSDKDYWNGHVTYCTAEKLLEEAADYSLIVVGDNHQSFTCTTVDGRTLVNCGSLMRSNILQVDHKPVCYVFSVESRKLTPYFLPIEPASMVFDLTEAAKSKEELLESKALIEHLEKGFDSSGINFLHNLKEAMNVQEEDVADMIKEVMNGK